MVPPKPPNWAVKSENDEMACGKISDKQRWWKSLANFVFIDFPGDSNPAFFSVCVTTEKNLENTPQLPYCKTSEKFMGLITSFKPYWL